MRKPLLTRVKKHIEHSPWFSHAVPIEIASVPFTADSTSCRAGAKYVDYDYAWLSALAAGRARFLDVGAGFGFTAMLCAGRMRRDGRCHVVLLPPDVDYPAALRGITQLANVAPPAPAS